VGQSNHVQSSKAGVADSPYQLGVCRRQPALSIQLLVAGPHPKRVIQQPVVSWPKVCVA
jgi:hypothetical protein